jgi:hypothetical protein
MIKVTKKKECRRLGYKNPVCTSQDTCLVSTTETSRLMLHNILGFHGGDYEECRHNILGFHGGDYEECRLLGYSLCGSFTNPLFKERNASIIRVARIGELRTLAVTINRRTQWRNIYIVFPYGEDTHSHIRRLQTLRTRWYFSASFGCGFLLTLFLVRRFLSPWWWKRYVFPKHQSLQQPQDVTSQ